MRLCDAACAVVLPHGFLAVCNGPCPARVTKARSPLGIFPRVNQNYDIVSRISTG